MEALILLISAGDVQRSLICGSFWLLQKERSIRRAEQTLRQIEEKTGLVARAMQRRQTLAEIAALVDALPDSEIKQTIARKLAGIED